MPIFKKQQKEPSNIFQFSLFLQSNLLILQSCLCIPILCLLHITLCSYSVFIKRCQIALGIAIPMLCRTLCPVKCLFKVLVNPQPLQIKISNLTFCQWIPLLC